MGKVVGAILTIMATLFGYVWVNGWQWDYCSGHLVEKWPVLVAPCPLPSRLIPTERIDQYLSKDFQVELDRNQTTDSVYDAIMSPRLDRSAEVEKAKFQRDFGQKDHVEYLGQLERVDRSNTFTFLVRMYKTTKPLTQDQRERSHQDAVYEWTLTMDFKASDPAFATIWGDAPNVAPSRNLMTWNADPFVFVKHGYFYWNPRSVKAEQRVTHLGPKYRQTLPAICVWIEPGYKKDGDDGTVYFTDRSKVWLDTLYGWVRLPEVDWMSQDGVVEDEANWPDKLIECATPQ